MAEEKTKKTTPAEKKKMGVYICHCVGNISDHVDVEKVRKRMEKDPGVAVARTNMFMCSDPGQELIMEDLKNGTIDRVVVASCAPSLHETTFRDAISRAGANPYIYEHANIREQVSWVHDGDSATDKATLLISAAAAKAGHLIPLEPIRVDARQHATIIGAGIAGMKAAKDLADLGIKVLIVEKSPFLGGRLSRLDRLAPTGENASDIIKELASQIIDNPMITVLTCAGDNPEKACIPFVMAVAAQAMDVEAIVILQGNGVHLAVKGYADTMLPGGGFPHIKKLISDFIEAGGKMKLCMPCLQGRKIEETDLIEGAEITASGSINVAAMEADAVLVY